MHRPDTEGAVAGQFSDGTPPLVKGTVLGAAFMNDQMENLIKLIEDASIALVKGDFTQVKAAVVWYVNAGITALKAAVNTWTAQNTFSEGGIFSRTTANTNAVGATGNGTGQGVEATGGAAGGAGVRGTGGGVGPGVIGRSLGAGDALIGDASSGTGNGIFAAGNATKAPIRTQPRGTPPTDAAISSIYSDTAGRHYAGDGTVWYPIGSNTATIQTNSVGNPGILNTEGNLHVTSIPPNRLVATPLVRIQAIGEITNSVSSKILRLYVGATARIQCTFPNNVAANYFLKGWIAKTGTNQQRVMVEVSLLAPGAAGSNLNHWTVMVDLTENESAAIEVKTTGEDGATANAIYERFFLIEYP